MQKYIQNTGSPLRLSAGRQEAIRKYRKFCTEFQAEQGRKPTEAELCRSLWITLEQLREIQYDACMTAVKSLDAPIKGAEGEEDTTLGELAASAADPCEELLDRLEQEELCSILWQCVDSLPGKQPDVIRSRYVDGKDAVAAIGSDDVQFLDVRDDDTYAKGHLKGSLQCGLKEFEDADAQKAMYELAQTMDSSKPVYILCSDW